MQGVDLYTNVSANQANTIREAWLKHRVLVFPEQTLSDDDLEEFTLCFGEFGEDPDTESIEGRKNICAIKRLAKEKSPPIR